MPARRSVAHELAYLASLWLEDMAVRDIRTTSTTTSSFAIESVAVNVSDEVRRDVGRLNQQPKDLGVIAPSSDERSSAVICAGAARQLEREVRKLLRRSLSVGRGW